VISNWVSIDETSFIEQVFCVDKEIISGHLGLD